jgi:7-keto-8-aminopelargonate synthetase-like enzyme
MRAPLYAELEHCLGEMFGGHVLVAPTTTLGHAASLPVPVGPQEAVIVDQQVHQSAQMAVDQFRCQGTVIEVIPHSDVNQLQAALAQHADHTRIWYLADGVYSMYAGLAPLEQLGAVQPPMLGAALASALIHLSPELHDLQRALRRGTIARPTLSTSSPRSHCILPRSSMLPEDGRAHSAGTAHRRRSAR